MTLTISILIIAALSLYSHMLVRRSTYILDTVFGPFVQRIHSPAIEKITTEREHFEIHKKLNMFNLRMLVCYVAWILAGMLALFFIVLAAYGGDVRLTGYMMTVLFAYLAANYNINSSALKWTESVDNKLLARLNVGEKDHKSLQDYLKLKNQEMISEYYEKSKKFVDEFEQITIEQGFDPEKEYDETNIDELIDILERSLHELREKYPELSDS